MSISDSFSVTAAYGWHARVLSGRAGLRLFLRLHQNATYPRRALHFMEVHALQRDGHRLVGVFNREGRLRAAAAVLLPDGNSPAVQRYASFARKMEYYEPCLARQGLQEASCHAALSQGCLYMTDGSGETLNTVTMTPEKMPVFVQFFAEPKLAAAG